jgi:hypothetical protein
MATLDDPLSAANDDKPHRLVLGPTIAVATSGLIVFAISGYLGYCPDPQQRCPASLNLTQGPALLIDSLFLKPWPLFLWLCMIILIVQHTMLSRLKGVSPEVEQAWRRWTYAVTGVSIVLVGVYELYGKQLLAGIQDWISSRFGGGFLFHLLSDSWFFTLLNFGIILLLAGGAITRWIRFRREQAIPIVRPSPADPEFAALTHSPQSLDDQDSARELAMSELVIGDILVRSAIVLIISFIIRAEVIGLVIPQPDPGSILPNFTSCSVALPGLCRPQLSFIDLILALLGLVGGVSFAGALAQAVVRQRLPAEPLPLRQLGSLVAAELLSVLTRPFTQAGSAGEGRRDPYDPLKIVSAVTWPVLVFCGVFAAATLASFTQRALHQTAWDIFVIPRFHGFPTNPMLWEIAGILAGLAALIGILLAALSISFKPETLRKGLEFIRENGFITLVLFCVYAFALWLIEALLRQFVAPNPDDLRYQAFRFGLFTIGSVFLLLWFVATVLARRSSQQRAVAASSGSAAEDEAIL